jgi:hypothetical protein
MISISSPLVECIEVVRAGGQQRFVSGFDMGR